MTGHNGLIRGDAGGTLIEYALVCFLIAVTCLLAVAAVGDNTASLYVSVCQTINTAVSGSEPCR